jgi:hypothetical protein
MLSAIEFISFLYSGRLSRGLAAGTLLLSALGWDWWFRDQGERGELTRLNLNAPTELKHDQR